MYVIVASLHAAPAGAIGGLVLGLKGAVTAVEASDSEKPQKLSWILPVMKCRNCT